MQARSQVAPLTCCPWPISCCIGSLFNSLPCPHPMLPYCGAGWNEAELLGRDSCMSLSVPCAVLKVLQLDVNGRKREQSPQRAECCIYPVSGGVHARRLACPQTDTKLKGCQQPEKRLTLACFLSLVLGLFRVRARSRLCSTRNTKLRVGKHENSRWMVQINTFCEASAWMAAARLGGAGSGNRPRRT
jgi:hypothetical protein